MALIVGRRFRASIPAESVRSRRYAPLLTGPTGRNGPATLSEGDSPDQFDQMRGAGLTLVVPRANVDSFRRR